MRDTLSFYSSVGNAPSDIAYWFEGFLRASGSVLLLDDNLWQLVNGWLCGLSAQISELLPVIRRTFSNFTTAERRKLGEKAKGFELNGTDTGIASGEHSCNDGDASKSNTPARQTSGNRIKKEQNMETEYLKRWRMALGGNAADGTGVTLTVEEQRLDSSLEAVYDNDRRGGLGVVGPEGKPLAWRYPEFFPQTVVQVIQRDAIKRLHIDSLLTEKEMLAMVVPDVHCGYTDVTRQGHSEKRTKDMARVRLYARSWMTCYESSPLYTASRHRCIEPFGRRRNPVTTKLTENDHPKKPEETTNLSTRPSFRKSG